LVAAVLLEYQRRLTAKSSSKVSTYRKKLKGLDCNKTEPRPSCEDTSNVILPEEILVNIFTYVTFNSFMNILCTCKSFLRIGKPIFEKSKELQQYRMHREVRAVHPNSLRGRVQVWNAGKDKVSEKSVLATLSIEGSKSDLNLYIYGLSFPPHFHYKVASMQ
jgi:hypothetical protein